MRLTNKVQPLIAKQLTAPWTGAWQELYNFTTHNGFDRPIFVLRIVNDSSVTLAVSYDGAIAYDVVPAHDHIQIYFQNNALQNFEPCYLPQGSKVYVQGVGGVGIAVCTGYSSYEL